MPYATVCDHTDPFTNECICEEFYALNQENNEHVASFNYSATSLAEARDFRLNNPDLSDLNSTPQSVWLGYSAEQRDYDSDELIHYEASNGLPENYFEHWFDNEPETDQDPYVPEPSVTYSSTISDGSRTWLSVYPKYRDYKPNEVTLTTTGAKPNPKAIKDPQPLDYSTVVPFPRNFRPHNFTTPLTEDHFLQHDEHLTELLHFRTYLNVFTGRYDGNLHMGSLAFTTHNDRIAVYCTTKGCHFSKDRPFTAPADPTREEQEDFILACIRHANNHDLRNRRPAKGQFIHAINCDANHDHYDSQRRPIGCNTNNPQLHPTQLDHTDLKELHYFLKQHMHYCKSTTCQCSHYESLIWDLTHPLALAS